VAGAAAPFPPTTVSAALAELVSADLLASGPAGLALTELGSYVAQSGLRVASAVRVARALRMLHPSQLIRATLIAAAQLTDELATVRPRVNGRGWQREQQTFFGELRRHGIAEPMLAVSTSLKAPQPTGIYTGYAISADEESYMFTVLTGCPENVREALLDTAT
jgi:hypothetical protein